MKLFRRLKALLRYPIPGLHASGVVLGITMAAFCFCSQAQAGSVTWNGNGTTWGAGANWTSGTAPMIGDVAVFDTTFSNQPTLTGTVTTGTAAGLWLTTGSVGLGQDVIISSTASQSLTLGGTATINGNANTAILLDDASNHNLTFGSTVTLTVSNSTSFLVNNAGTLSITGTLNISGESTLTLGGTNALGNIKISGNIAPASGPYPWVVGVNVNTAGTVTLTGTNAFTGGLTLTSGTLAANSSFSLGARNGSLYLKGGTLLLSGTSGQNCNVNTYVSGTAQIITDIFDVAHSNAGLSTSVTGSYGSLYLAAGSNLTVLGGSDVKSGAAGLSFATTTTLAGNATFNIVNPSLLTGTATTVLSLGTINDNGNTLTLTGNGSLAQATAWSSSLRGGLTLDASYTGTSTLNQKNSFTGLLTINGGTIVATTSASALGQSTASNAVTLNGGTLILSNPSGVNLNFGANVTVLGNSQIFSNTAPNTTGTAFGNTYALGSLTIGNQILTIANSSALGLFYASGTGTNLWGTAGITFGATTLTGNATFNIVNSLLSGTSSTLLTLGSINSNGYNITLTGNGGFAQTGVWSGTGGLILGGTAPYSGTATLSQNNTFTGGVTVGGGQLNLNGTSYSSGLTISGGTVTLGNVLGLGQATASVAFTGTTGKLQINNSAIAVAVTISALSGTSPTTSVTSSTSGTASDTLIIASLPQATGTYAGVLADGTSSHTLALTMAGSGLLTLTGSNTFTGGVTLTGGTLNGITASLNSGTNTIIFNGGTLQAGSGGIIASKAVTMVGNGTFDTNGNDSVISGTLSGIGVLTKNGTGKLTLSGVNTTTGGLVLNSGTLAAGSTTALGSGNITFGTSSAPTLDLNNQNVSTGLLSGSGFNGVVTNSGTASIATLTLFGSGTQSFAGIISNGGTSVGLTKAGNGTQILNGNVTNNYTGNTTISGGTLKLDFSNMSTPTNLVSGSSNLVLGGGTLIIQGKNSTVTNQTFASLNASGGPGFIVITPGTSGTATLTITGTSTTYAPGATVNFNIAGGTASTAIVLWNPALTGGLIGGAYTVTDSVGTGFATVSGGMVVRLTGSTALTSAASTATINYTTTPTDAGYSGGTLTMTNATHTLNSLVITSGSGGTLNLSSQSMTFNGALLMTGTGNYTITNGTLGASGTTLIIHQFGSGVLTVSGTMGGGAASLTMDGTGILALTSTNNFNSTGTTTINGGTLQISGSGNLSASGIALNGGILEVTTGGFTLGRTLTVGGSGGVLQVDSGTLTEASAVSTGTSNLTISGSGSTTITNSITGTGSLTKAGNGILTLSASNGFTGGLIINGGAVVATTSLFALGQSVASNAVALNSGTLVLRASSSGTMSVSGANVIIGGNAQMLVDAATTGTGNTYTFGALSIGNGNPTLSIVGGSNVTSGTAGITFGATTLTGNVTFNFTKPTGGITLLTLGAINDNGYTLTLTGTGNFAQTAAWGSGAGGGVTLDANYSGTTVLNQVNRYTGTTTISGGTLVATGTAGMVNALGSSIGAVVLNGGALVLSSSSGTSFQGTGRNFTVGGNAQIGSDITVGSGSLGNTYTLGSLTIGNQILTVAGGANVSSGTAGITFGATALTGNVTFNILNPANGGVTLLTLGAITNGVNNLILTGSGNFAQTGPWGNGSGGLILSSTYSGVATLSQNNTFTGGVVVGGGKLNLNGDSASSGITITGGTVTLGNALGLGKATSSVAFGGAGTAGKLQLNGYNVTISVLSGSSSSSIIENGSATNSALTLTDALQVQNTYAGVLADGTNGGILSLIKAGGGTLILTGTNTHTGLLTLSGGILNATTASLNGSNVANGIVFNGGTLQSGIGGISTAKAIAMNGAGIFDTGAPTTSSTLSGVISGSGVLTVSGSGLLTLTGTNTLTGGLTLTSGTLNGSTASLNSGTNTIALNGGTLQAGAGGITVSTAVTLAGNGTFDTNGNDSVISGTLSGIGVLTKNGAGKLTLSGVNTTTGGLVLNNGTLVAGSAMALGSGNITFGTSNTPTLDLNNQNVSIGLLSGSGSNGVITNSFASGTATLSLFTSGTQSYAGVIQNGATAKVGLIKADVGTQILNGYVTNNYTGNTTINGGTLELDFSNMSTPTNLVSGNSALVLGGGTLIIQGKSSTATNQTFASLNVSSGPGSIVIAPGTSGTATLTITSGTVTRAAGATVNFNTSAGTSTTARVLWNASPTNGIIGGAYTMTDNGGTGFATVTSGSVVRLATLAPLTTTNATASTSGSNFTTTPSDPGYTNGTLTLTNVDTHATNTLVITSGGGGTLNLGSQVMMFNAGALLMTGTGNYTITSGTLGASGAELLVHQFGTGTLTVASDMGGGAVSLTMDGTGVLALSSNNNFNSTGTTTLNGGTLQISGSGNLSSGGIVLSGGALEVTSADFALGRTLTAGGSGGVLQVDSGTLTQDGLTVINSALTLNGAGNLLFTGTVSGAGGLILASTYSGAATLSGSNTFTGAVTMNGGQLNLNSPSVSGGIIITGGTVTLGDPTGLGQATATVAFGGVGTGDKLQINGNDVTIGALSGSSALSIVENGGASDNTLTIADAPQAQNTYAGVLADGINGGLLWLNKAGAGTLILTGTNTYTGQLTLSGGVLITGSAGINAGDTTNGIYFNGGTLQSDSGGLSTAKAITMDGSGTFDTGGVNSEFSGPIAVNSNTLFQVNNSGTLTMSGDLSIAGGSTLTLGGNNAAGNIVISGNIVNYYDNSGAVIVSAAGTVTLSGSNAFTGGLTLNSGILKATNSIANLGAVGSSLTLNGGTLWLADSVGENYNTYTTVSGTAPLPLAVQIISDVATPGVGLTYGFGTLYIGATGGSTLTVSGGPNATSGTAGITFTSVNLSGTSTTFKILNNGTAITLLNVGAINNFNYDLTLDGNGNFAQTGIWGNGSGGMITASTYSGTAILSQNNTFTGAVTMNGGTVLVNNAANALGNAAGAVTMNGGVLVLTSTTGGAMNIGRSFIVGGNVNIVSDVLSSGNGNTYTLGALSIGSQTLTITGGGNVNGGTAGITFGATTLTGNAIFNILNPVGGGAAKLTLGAITNGTNNITVNGNGAFAQSGVLGNGSGGVIFTSTYSGSATLNQNNTFTGGVTVGGGLLTLSGSSASSGITITGGTVVLNSASGLGSPSATVTISGTSDLQINVSLTIGALNGTTGASIIEGIGGARILTVNDSGTDSYIGVLRNGTGGTLALIKSGSGTLTLTNVNTFTGGLVLSGGILNVSSASIGNPVNGIIFNSGTLQVGGGGLNTSLNVAMTDIGTIDTNGFSPVFSGIISGGGVLTKTGVGSLTLSGSNTFSSGLVINNGTVVAGTATSLGSGNITFGTSNTPTVDLKGQNVVTGLLSGSGSNGVITNSFSSGTATLSLFTSGTQLYAGVIQNGASAKVGLTKADIGTQILNGYVSNTYTGNTTINGGTLKLDFSNMITPANLVNSTSNLSLGGGTLRITGTNVTSQTFASLSLTGSTANIIALEGSNTTLTLGNTWTRNAGATLLIDYSSSTSGTRQIVTPGTISAGTGISGSNNGIFGWLLVKDYNGVVGFGTRAAGTNVAVTRYDDTTATALATSSSNATTNFTTLNSTYSTGTLSWSSGITNRSVNSLVIDTTIQGGVIDTGTSTNILTLTSGAVLFRGNNNETLMGGQLGVTGSELIIHQTSTTGTLTIKSSIVGAGTSLTKDGDGVLALTGSSTYNGATNINGGTIQISSTNGSNYCLGVPGQGFGSGTIALNNNSTLEVTSGSFTLGHTFVANGSGGVLKVDAGTLVQDQNTSIASDLTVKGAGNLTFSGGGALIYGAGGLTIDASYSGTATLSASNTYTGGLTINGGTVVATGTTSQGLSTAANALALNGGTLVLRAASSITMGASAANPSNVTVGGNAQMTADTTGLAANTYTFGTLWIGSQTLTIASGGTSATTGTAGVTFGGTVLTGNATFNLTKSGTLPILLTVGAIDDNGNTLTLTGNGNFAQSAAWGLGGTSGGLTLGVGFSGTATLSQLNAYAGATTINGGWLQLNAANTLPITTALTITGGTMSLGVSANSIASLNLQGGTIINSGATGTLTVASTILAQSGTIAAVISDAAGLTKSGTGTVMISGSNNPASNLGLTGTVTINGGTLIATDISSETAASGLTRNITTLGPSTNTLALNSGALLLSYRSGTAALNFGSNVTVSGSSQITMDTVTTGSGNTYMFGALAIGSGTLTVASGTNVTRGTAGLSFTGTTTLGGNSTLKISGTTALLTLAGISDKGFTLTLDGNGNFAQSAAWSASLGGGLTLAATYTGTAVLNQSNNYTGATTINGGTLLAQSSSYALGAGTPYNVLILNGGNLILSAASGTPIMSYYYNTQVTGNAQITSSLSSGTGAGSTLALANLTIGSQMLTVAGGTNVTSGTACIYFTGTTTLTGNATFKLVNPLGGGSGFTLLTLGAINSNGYNNITLTGSGGFSQVGVWSGAGGLILGGTTPLAAYSGTTTLSSNNTFTGGVIVNGGQLNLNGSSYSSGITINSGTVTLGNALGLGQATASVTFSGTAGKLQLTSGTTAVAVTISALSGTSTKASITSGTSGTATDTLIVIGYPQTQNTYAGVLADGTNSHNLALTMAGSGTLILTGTNTYTGLLTLNGGILNATTAAINGTNTISGITYNGGTLQAGSGGITTAKNVAMTGAGTFDTGTAGTSSVLSGTISGGGALTVAGSGRLTLTGTTNAFNGGLILTGGTLNGTNAALNISGNAITFNGGTLQSGSGGIAEGLSVTLAGNGTFDTNGNNSTISGVLAGSGTFMKTGVGMLTLSGANTFDGGVVIAGGALQANNNQSGVLGSGNIMFTASGTVLDLSGQSPTIGLLASGSNYGTVTNTGSGAATLTLFGSGTQSFSGIIQNNIGVIGLIKTGVGVQILNGNVASSYTGSTTISGGTLKLDFSNMSTPTNLVNSNSALVLGGGTLIIQGRNSTTTNQTFASLNASGGPGFIVIAPGTSGTATLAITDPTITRAAGATVNFNTSAGTSTTARVLWNASPTNGIIGGAYTMTDNGGTGFATVTSGSVVRLATLAPLTTTNATASTSGSNFTTTPSDPGYTNGTLTLTNVDTHATNTLVITSGGGGTLNLGSQVMMFNAGALLMTGTGNYTITSGTLGASGAELLVHQFGTGTLTVASDMGGGAVSLTMDGTGVLALSSNNNFNSTGTTTLNGGTLQISGSGNLSSGGIVLSGGALEVTSADFALGRTLTAGGSGGVLQVDSGTLTEASAVSTGTSNLTISGSGNMTLTTPITGIGVLTKAGSGTLLLSNVTNNTSGLAITSGTVMLGAAQTITNHYGLSMSGTSTLDLNGYAFTLNNTSANSVAFGAGTLLMNSGAARTTFNGVSGGLTLNFNGGTLGGNEIWVGSNSPSFTLNIASSMGSGSRLYVGQSTGTSATAINLTGTSALNLGALIEARCVSGTQTTAAIAITVANTVTGFSGGSIISSEYAVANPLGINNIYTTANNSLVFAAGGTGFTLSGGTVDVRSLAANAGPGGIATNGNGLTISGGNLLGNYLPSTTGSIALQSGNLLLINAGVAGTANFTISGTAGNDGRTIQMVSGNTGTFTVATGTNPGFIITGTLADGGTWDRGTLNSGSNYTIAADSSGSPVFGSSFANFTIADNSGFAGIITGTNAITTGTLNLGVNSTFFALSSAGPSLAYNVGVANGVNNIVVSAAGGFVFGVKDSSAYSTGTINLNRDKGNSNITLLSNGASTSNAININANQTGSGNLYVAAQNLTLNSGFTFGGTGGILTDLNPISTSTNGQINYVLSNGAGNFNGAAPVSTFLTINGAITGTNTIFLNAESASTLNSGIALGATNAVVGGVQTWTVHQTYMSPFGVVGIAFGNAMTNGSNWTNGSVSFSQLGNYSSFEAATNSSAPSSASSNYKFNSLSIVSSGTSIGQYVLTNSTQNDGGTLGAKEGLYTGSLSLVLSDTNNSRYTFDLSGQDLYVDRFNNVNSIGANGLIWMNDATGTVSDIRAIGTAGDTLVTGGFHVLNGATLEIVGGDYNNLISSRSKSLVPSDSAAAPNSGISAVTAAYDASSNYTPSANISFLGSGPDNGNNGYSSGQGNGTLRIVGGKMTTNAYILNPVGSVGLIDTTSSSAGDTTLNTVTLRASSSQALSTFTTGTNPAIFTPTVAGVYSNGDIVQFATTGTLPGGLTANTTYYVVNTGTNGTFSVATTPGGSAVTLSSTGSGTINVQDPAGASDVSQFPALIVGGTTTINGNLVLANAPGAVNQSTLRVGAVNENYSTSASIPRIFNQANDTAVAMNIANKGSGYTNGTNAVTVSFTTGAGTSGTVQGVAVAANGVITSLTLDLSSTATPLDLFTTFGTITSGTVTSGTAGAFTLTTGGVVSPIVYLATQTTSSAVLNVTGDLISGSTNNLAIQSNGAVYVGGNVNIQGVGQNQVMLITGTGVGIAPNSNFTLNGNKGASTPQTVNIVPALGAFHVGDGRNGTLTGTTGIAAQATLTGNLMVSSNSDINGSASSLSLAGNTLTLDKNSTLTVGGKLNVGSALTSGTVIVTGSLGGGGLKFNSGSTLAGNGSIISGSTGSLTINNGVAIVPGDPTTGTGKLDLTSSNLSVSGSLTLSLAVTSGTATGTAGTSFAQLATGTLNLTNVTKVTVSLQTVAGDGETFDPTLNHLWQNIITTTALTGFNTSLFTIDPTNFFTGSLQGGVFSMVQDQTNSNVIDLQYLASVPEPQTWALLVGGVGLLGLAQRLRRRFQS